MKNSRKRRPLDRPDRYTKRSVAAFITICLFLLAILILNPASRSYIYVHPLNQWLRNYPAESMMYIMGIENKHFRHVLPNGFEPPNVLSVTVETFTDIQSQRIATLLLDEVPGFKTFDTKIIVAGEGTNYSNLPVESSPPMDVLLKERELSKENLREIEKTDKSTDHKHKEPLKTTEGKKVAFIYHTHSRESFLPYLKGEDNPDNAHDSKVNIMLVGKKLGEKLEQKGIGTEVNTTDVVKELESKGLDYRSSYKMTREILQTSTNQNRNLTFFFDLHRDSQRRSITTKEINGKNYARLFFIIGTEYKNYEKNLQFAKGLNTLLEKNYPGISRGIFEKNKTQGNGVYNQDLSTHSIIIEVGGVDNTMEEMYRTTDALAEVIADYYWQAEAVTNQ
ncbi:stage II sporulation protein P (plasmid) [Priestia megaterium]|uniref:stage II sporulation protein P n=1 Tax=Priestia megaterium TaxID=1404 RepID=UPI001EDC22A6|nr:stage II sporulation protein P [Priestia megaterium]UKJ83969.1 stage II sporulation protein P [Priestia megaterium]